jgi:hypothetical protein
MPQTVLPIEDNSPSACLVKQAILGSGGGPFEFMPRRNNPAASSKSDYGRCVKPVAKPAVGGMLSLRRFPLPSRFRQSNCAPERLAIHCRGASRTEEPGRAVSAGSLRHGVFELDSFEARFREPVAANEFAELLKIGCTTSVT